MPESHGTQARWGRETRLLLLVVAVSVAVLLVVARFRFPAPALTAGVPPTGPIATLAGRNVFDDLSSSMGTLAGRLSNRVAVVRLEPVPEPAAATAAARRARAGREPAEPAPVSALMPGLRIRDDLIVVYSPAHVAATTVDGASIDTARPIVTDATREVAVLHAPSGTTADVIAAAVPSFAYVGEVGALSSGVTVRPAFLGRVEQVTDDRWPGAVFAPDSGAGVALGAVLFTMDGHLVGLVVRGASGPVIVPEATLLAAIDQILQAPGVRP